MRSFVLVVEGVIIVVSSIGIIGISGHFDISRSTSSRVEFALGFASVLARLERMRECKS